MEHKTDFLLKMTLDAWLLQLKRANTLLETLPDTSLPEQVAPGRNTGLYLFGHLTAVHDAMLPLMMLGDKLYPELEEIFIKNPDRSGLKQPFPDEIKLYWNTVNTDLNKGLSQLRQEEWFERHSAVSEEDFEKEPHRNKLSILISRTSHIAYHLGQLRFLKV
jgi:hypothetical protein